MARTCTWNSGSTANWSVSGSWSCSSGSGPPIAGDAVVFGSAHTGTCTINTSVSVATITIQASAGTVTQGANTITTTSDFTQAGGTFTGGTSDITIGGNLALSNGTFTSTSTLLEIQGLFNKTGGTFTHNSGRVMLSSTASSNAFTSNGATFNNLFINDGLVAYWKLDENSGTSIADSSGYGNTGTLVNGPTWITGANLPTLNFSNTSGISLDGSNDYATLGVSNLPDMAGNLTVSLWMYYASVPGSSKDAITLTNGSSYLQVGFLNAVGISAWNSGGIVRVTASSTPASGWHHVAYTYNGTTHTIYVDGTATTSTNSANSGTPTSAYLGTWNGANELYTGRLDDIRIYSRVLSSTEISSLAGGDQPGTSVATQTVGGNPIIAGDLVIASGTLAAGNTTIQVAGNWWNYGGLFTTGATGGVTFNGSASGKKILASGQAFNDVTISGTGAWAISDTGAITLGGDYTQSAGTFTSTPDLLNIAGAFNKTGGTFTHNSGRVMLSSTTSQTFASNGATFNDLYINDGLVGYWKFDDAASPSVDSSGYGRDATWSSSPLASSTVPVPALNFTNPKSLGFDSAADSTNFTSPSAPVVTLAGWIKPTAAGGGNKPRICDMPGYLFFLDDSTLTAPDNPLGLSFQSNRATTRGEWASPANGVSYGTWYHVAVTYDSSSTGNVPVFYINGVAQTPLTTKFSPVGAQTSNVGTGYIGNAPAANRNWNGLIDDLRLYNRVLSASEIYSLYIGNQPGTSVATASATQSLTGSPIIAGDLTIASGWLDGGTNGLTVAGGWLNYGGLFTAGSTGLVTLNGTSGSHEIRSAGQMFGAITVNGSGGTWTLADRLEMNPASTLTTTAGTFSLSSYTLRGGNIDKNGVAMTPSTGKVVLDGSTSFTTDQGTFTDLRVEPVAATALVGYWKLDAGQGLKAKDFGSGAHDGTLTNGPLWLGSSNVPNTIKFYDPGAVSFDGSDDYIDAGAAATASNAAFTACAWMNMDVASGHQTAVSIDGTNVSGFYLKRDTSGPFSFQMRSSDSTGSTLYFATGTTTPVVATWYHICGVYDGSNAKLYVNGNLEATSASVASTWNATGHTIIGAAKWNGSAVDFVNGTIDDVRIYNTALTLAQVAALAAGTYPVGLSGSPTYTFGAATTISGTFAIDSGTLTNGSSTVDATSASVVPTVYGGTYSVGSAYNKFTDGLTVNKYGTLNLSTASGSVQIASGKTLTVDGTLSASTASATIQSVSGTYAFMVGNSANATPTLNITGLAVKNTDANGMYINPVSTSTTTFSRFDGIAFSNGTAGASNRLLRIYAPTLYLVSNGCTFDASTGKNVTLAGDGTTTETRAVFGNATCTNTPCESYDDDDDSDTDGVGAAGANGAVIQWVHSALSDTSGTLVGFPVAAFDWNLFTYYSSYVAYHDVGGGTADRLYVRDSNGNPNASYATAYWDGPSGEDFVGAPRFDTVSSTHYVYVATTAGKVYRLVDDTSAHTLTLASGWAANPYVCACTISTPLTVDSTNIYWGGVASGNKVWTLIKSTGALPTSPASPVTVTNVISGAAPTVWVDGSAHNQMFLGSSAVFYKVDVTNQSTVASYSTSVSGTVNGRISLINTKMYGADNAGTLFVLTPSTMALAWKYANPDASAVTSSVYVDFLLDYAYYGDSNGHLLAAKFSSGTSGTNLTGFPYLPTSGSASDVYGSAVLYDANILVAGTTTGNVYIVDNSSGTPVMRQTYKFGTTTNISGIGYNKQTTSYMISTSDPTNKDGKLIYIDRVIKLN